MATITWLDKIDGLDLANPRKNVDADDMNQIKTAVNTNDGAHTSHTGNTSNPHSVTKAQVGLSNVDNTADSAKPVSTDQSTALAGKQATLVSGTNIKTVQGTNLLGSGDVALISDGISNGSMLAPTQNILFDALAAVDVSIALRLLISNIVFNEVPTGTINGTNDTFSIANNVLSGLVMFFSDGLCVNPDGFELTGTTVVFTIPPDNSLTVTYIKA